MHHHHNTSTVPFLFSSLHEYHHTRHSIIPTTAITFIIILTFLLELHLYFHYITTTTTTATISIHNLSHNTNQSTTISHHQFIMSGQISLDLQLHYRQHHYSYNKHHITFLTTLFPHHTVLHLSLPSPHLLITTTTDVSEPHNNNLTQTPSTERNDDHHS